MAKKTFIVAHPKLTLKSDGRMTRMVKGSEIIMEEKHAASLVKQGKLFIRGQEKPVSIGSKSESGKKKKDDDQTTEDNETKSEK